MQCETDPIKIPLNTENKGKLVEFYLRPNRLLKPNDNIKYILQLEKFETERQYGGL